MLSAGYELSAQSLNILFNRFSKKRKYMNLDDFAACLSRVKIMSGGCAFCENEWWECPLCYNEWWWVCPACVCVHVCVFVSLINVLLQDW